MSYYLLKLVYLLQMTHFIHFPSHSWAMQLSINVINFLLRGLTEDPRRKNIVLAIFLFFYIGTLVGNLLIIATIKTSQALGSPMYYFLFYLSLSDTCFSTTIAPRTIVDSLYLFQWVLNPSLCITFIWCPGGLHSHPHGCWPLCGHL